MLTKKRLGLFGVGFIIWSMLGGFAPQEMILGALISAIVALLYGETSVFSFRLTSLIGIIKFVFVYIPVFIFELIKANLDVMLRVLNPRLPIHPGFVRVPTELKGDLEKLVLANSITLTPGTITLDADDEALYVHWIDIEKGQAEAVGEPFESLLRRMFK